MEKPGDGEEEEEDFDDGAGKAALMVEFGGDEVASTEVKVRVDFPASRATLSCSSCFQTFSLLALSSFRPLCGLDHINTVKP